MKATKVARGAGGAEVKDSGFDEKSAYANESEELAFNALSEEEQRARRGWFQIQRLLISDQHLSFSYQFNTLCSFTFRPNIQDEELDVLSRTESKKNQEDQVEAISQDSE